MVSSEVHAEPIDILLVEDNPGDIRLLEEAFDDVGIPNDLHVVTSGTRAVDYLRRRNGYEEALLPDFVLLDLDLPGQSGWDVLEEIHEEGSPEVKAVPVIVLTNSEALDEMFKSLDRQVHAYFTKPYDPKEYRDLARSIFGFVSSDVASTGAK